MTDQAGSEGSARTAYDTVAADYARAIRDTNQEHPLDVAMIDAFLAEVGAGPILDAGAGAGRLTGYAAARGADIRGMDLSPGMIAQARSTYPDLRFETGSLLDLPYPAGSFDGVLLWYSVIHLGDDELGQALSEVARVTRPGGYILLASQAGTGEVDLRPVYARMGHQVSLTRHRRTAEVLAAALARVGARELARLERQGRLTHERDDQAVILARFGPPE